MSNIKYSVLRYTPSFIRGESINIGIFIDVYGDTTFYPTSNFRRLEAFDDELDITRTKDLLNMLVKELSSSLINSTEEIYNKLKHYVNEFAFSKILEIPVDGDETKTVENLKKEYLRYDYEKKNRLSTSEERKLIKAVLKVNHFDYQSNKKISGIYNEAIYYDYVFNGYGIKFLNFNDKDLSKSVNSIKAWAWNCKNNTGIKTIIVYCYDEEAYPQSKQQVDILLKILSEATDKVFDVQKSIDFLNGAQSIA